MTLVRTYLVRKVDVLAGIAIIDDVVPPLKVELIDVCVIGAAGARKEREVLRRGVVVVPHQCKLLIRLKGEVPEEQRATR